MWWRLVALSRALGGESGQTTRTALDDAIRRNARAVVMLGTIHLVEQGAEGQYEPIVAPGIRTLLDALMRDPAMARLILAGELPLARTICRPLDPGSCRHSRAWRQQLGGDWRCGVRYPLPHRQRAATG